MKKVLLSLFCLCFVCLNIGLAQTSFDGEKLTLLVVWESITHYGLFVLGFYELVIRFFPTVRSYSLLSEIIQVIDFIIPDNSTEGVTHQAFVKSLTIKDVKVGDTVKTKSGDIVKILDVINGKFATQNTEGGEASQIGLDDIILIVKKGYLLVDTIKSIISFFKGLFKKPTTA